MHPDWAKSGKLGTSSESGASGKLGTLGESGASGKVGTLGESGELGPPLFVPRLHAVRWSALCALARAHAPPDAPAVGLLLPLALEAPCGAVVAADLLGHPAPMLELFAEVRWLSSKESAQHQPRPFAAAASSSGEAAPPLWSAAVRARRPNGQPAWAQPLVLWLVLRPSVRLWLPEHLPGARQARAQPARWAFRLPPTLTHAHCQRHFGPLVRHQRQVVRLLFRASLRQRAPPSRPHALTTEPAKPPGSAPLPSPPPVGAPDDPPAPHGVHAPLERARRGEARAIEARATEAEARANEEETISHPVDARVRVPVDGVVATAGRA